MSCELSLLQKHSSTPLGTITCLYDDRSFMCTRQRVLCGRQVTTRYWSLRDVTISIVLPSALSTKVANTSSLLQDNRAPTQHKTTLTSTGCRGPSYFGQMWISVVLTSNPHSILPACVHVCLFQMHDRYLRVLSASHSRRQMLVLRASCDVLS